MSLAIEAHARNIIAHGMEGFDYDALKKNLQISDSFTIESMIALGKPGNREELPQNLKERETPTTRKPLTELIAKGTFPFK